MRPTDPAIRALSDPELAARRDVLAQLRRSEANRLDYLRRIARRHDDADTPEVDVSLVAAELMYKEAHAHLEADTLWRLAGWRRDLASLTESIAVVQIELARSPRDRGIRLAKRLDRLQLDAKATAARIATSEQGIAATRDDVARLLDIVAGAHLQHARQRERVALKRARADAEACQAKLAELSAQLAVIRKEINARLRLVRVEAFLARKGEIRE